MLKKKILGLGVAFFVLLSFNSVVLADADIHQSTPQTNLVQRIRTADKLDSQNGKDTIKERIDNIMAEYNKPADVKASELPKVAIMYLNNSKSTYDDEVDREIFKYLNNALPETDYELIDGSPYMEILKQSGYDDPGSAERADFMDAFANSGIDYCIYLEVQPFIARDKMTFFTIGKDITTVVPLKILNLTTGKYLYNGKFTEKASDSTVIGGIGNKSVSLKALDSAGEKMLKEIKERLPKTKA